MRKSYRVCTLLLILIILVMIVGGIIQDRRTKRARIIASVSKTMDAAGCVEVPSDYDPEQENINRTETKMNATKIEEVASSVLAENRIPHDDSRCFSAILGSVFHDARYRVDEIEIDGAKAIVKVELFYENQSDFIYMHFSYVDGGWVLEDGEEAVLSLFSKEK